MSGDTSGSVCARRMIEPTFRKVIAAAMRRSRKIWFWIAGGMALCGWACVSICIAQSMFESWRARNFLRIISTMQPGITTEADALSALSNYGPGADSSSSGERLLSRVWDESSGSFLEANGKGYSFNNSGLHFLHLAGKKAIDGTLYFRQARLVLIFASQTESNPECLVRVKEAARDFNGPQEPQGGKAVSLDERGSPVTLILVNVYPSATQSEKSKAYALNPGRLASLFPCRDARNLIPYLSQ